MEGPFSCPLHLLLLGTLLWVLTTPLTLPLVLLPLLLLRLLHHGTAALLRPDLSPIWGWEDAILALAPTSTPGWNMNTAQIWRVEGVLDAVKLRSHFFASFLSSPDLCRKYANLRTRLVSWGAYTFKQRIPVEDIDLNQLIQERGVKEGTDFQLEAFIAEWMADSKDYGEKGPAWAGLIVPLPSFNQTLFLLKMDHALTDGYTFVHLVSVLAGVKPPYRVHGQGLGIWRRLEIFLSFPAVALQHVWSYWATGPLPYPSPTKEGDDASKEKKEWMISFTRLDLERVKEIRRLSGGGVKFNTVLGSVVVGALRRHCLHHQNGEKDLRLPSIAWLPSPTGWPNHPAMTSGGGMGNHMSLQNHTFPFAEPDPLVRLEGGEASVRSAEMVGLPFGFHWVVAPLGWLLPSSCLGALLRAGKGSRLVAGGTGQVLTPLLLSPEPHTLLGLDVLQLYLPVHVPHFLVSTSVYVVPISVGGRLEVSVSGRRDAFPDQSSLDSFTKVMLAQELDLLYAAITDKQCKKLNRIANHQPTLVL